MLPVVRDDTETKEEAAQRISEVPTLTVQQHKRNQGHGFATYLKPVPL